MEVLGGRLPRDVGERAALEVVRTYPFADDDRALLSDDRDAERLSIVEPAWLVLIGTWDYLRQLAEAQRIQSADIVCAAVFAAGIALPTRGPCARGA